MPAYFLGKSLSEIPFLCINCFVFATPIVAIAPWQSPLDLLYLTYLCIGFVVLSTGFLLSQVFSDADAAVLTGAILSVLINLFSGFVPLLGDGPIGVIAYSHYSARAICTVELWYGQGIDNTEDYNNGVPDEWKDPNLGSDWASLVIMGLLLQVGAFLVMVYYNRDVASFS
jgi:hypothetical protein